MGQIEREGCVEVRDGHREGCVEVRGEGEVCGGERWGREGGVCGGERWGR